MTTQTVSVVAIVHHDSGPVASRSSIEEHLREIGDRLPREQFETADGGVYTVCDWLVTA